MTRVLKTSYGGPNYIKRNNRQFGRTEVDI